MMVIKPQGITTDEFADAVASALLDHVLWQHLPKDDGE